MLKNLSAKNKKCVKNNSVQNEKNGWKNNRVKISKTPINFCKIILGHPQKMASIEIIAESSPIIWKCEFVDTVIPISENKLVLKLFFNKNGEAIAPRLTDLLGM